VALSCGGTLATLARKGESIAVITVFAASPPANLALSMFASQLHRRWRKSVGDVDFPDPPAVRRQEDLNALRVLSPDIQVIHLDGLDCIYRVHPETGRALYDSEAALFGKVDPADPAIAALQCIPPFPAGSLLYAPLGVGNHVDHQIVRDAVGGWNLPPEVGRCYEDYPYSAECAAIEAELKRRESHHEPALRPVISNLDDQAIEAKIAAVAEYASQIGTFWPGLDAMSSALRDHAARIGGEPFWL
jgi:LmbE family N-acetylglucosaminyl deacetylase